MSSYSICPGTEKEWATQASANRIVGLHGKKEFSSASTLALEQFLALKVIWKLERDINVLNRDGWAQRIGTLPGAIQRARNDLKKETAWNEYLACLPRKLPPNSAFPEQLGRFAMVLQNQRIVSKLSDAKRDAPKVEGSPMTTRSGLRLGEFDRVPAPQLGNLGLGGRHVGTGPDNPQRQGQHASPARSQSRARSNADSELSDIISAASILSFYDETISKAERAAMADEQVVNTAAISFLQSLFVNDARTAYWSPQRKGFRFGKTNFKAYTDGHLQVVGEGDTRSAAILEVKARKRPGRDKDDFKIEWQESAQMAL